MMDLELEKFGLELYPGRYDFAMTFKDGKAIVPDAWDVNGYFRAIERLSPHDANVFKDIYIAMQPLQSSVWSDFIYSAPSPERWDRFVNQFSKLPHVPEDWWDTSGFELVDLLFKDEHVKAWRASIPHAITMPQDQKIIGPMESTAHNGLFWSKASDRRLPSDSSCIDTLHNPLRGKGSPKLRR